MDIKYKSRGFTLLGAATPRAFIELIKRLISLNTSVNVLDIDGYSPLTWSYYRNNIAMIELLAKKWCGYKFYYVTK